MEKAFNSPIGLPSMVPKRAVAPPPGDLVGMLTIGPQPRYTQKLEMGPSHLVASPPSGSDSQSSLSTNV